MKYESTILKRLIDTYGVVGNPRYISEIIKEFIVQGKECFPNLFTYQADWLSHIDEFGLNPTYTVTYTGQSIYAPNTLEKPIKSAILKGQTLVNVLNYIFRNNYSNVLVFNIRSLNNIKPLTSYLMYIIDETNKVVGFNISNNNSNTIIERTDGTKTKVTTNDFILNNQLLYIYPKNGIVFEDSDVNKIKIMLIEYQEGMENWDIPYFTGMQSVKLPVLTTSNYKNLANDIFIDYGYISDGTIDNQKKWLISDFISIEPNVSYTTRSQGATNDGVFAIAFYDEDKTFISKKVTNNAISPTNAKFARINVRKRDGLDITEEEKNDTILYLEKTTEILPFESHKTNILTVNEEVELRGIGDVKDELDLTTGKLTQRIECIDKNYTNWIKNTYISDEKTSYFTTETLVLKPDSMCISNKIPYNADLYDADTLGCKVGGYVSKSLEVRIENEKLDTDDVQGFIKYLTDNDVTFSAIKEQEVVKTVDLSILDQNGQNVKQLMSFNGGTHINTGSLEGSPLPSVSVSVETDLEETLMVCSLEGNTL